MGAVKIESLTLAQEFGSSWDTILTKAVISKYTLFVSFPLPVPLPVCVPGKRRARAWARAGTHTNMEKTT